MFYENSSDGSVDLMLVELAGGQLRSLGKRRDLGGDFEWFPDGERILMYRRDTTLAVIALDGKIERELAIPDSLSWVYAATVSPDGRKLALTAAGSRGINLVSIESQTWTHLPRPPGMDGGLQLLWAEDGFIYFNHEFTRDADGRSAMVQHPVVWRIAASGGAPELYLETGLACPWYSPSISRDARRFVCVVYQQDRDIWIADNFDPRARR